MDITSVDDSLYGLPEKTIVGGLLGLLRPPERLSSKEWAEAKRVLGTDVSAIPGRYDSLVTPYMLRVMEAVDDPEIKVIVGIKSAQIAWTETINNCIGRRIDVDPCNIIIAFPTQTSGSAYVQEKFKPFVRSTPELLKAIGDPDKKAWHRFHYPGGFIKFVTAGSPAALKSTAAPFLIVEEPSELKDDVKNQGDALDLFKERQKTFPDRTLIFGGTPTDKGFCQVDAAYPRTCQYVYLVPCHHCGAEHELSFDNLRMQDFPDKYYSPDYGDKDPETVKYHCPKCSEPWTDHEKNMNVLEAIKYNEKGWKKMNPGAKEVGFRFNELLSPFPGSAFLDLAKKWRSAEAALATGKEGKMKAFVNNSMGEAYEPKSNSITVEYMDNNALSYAPRTVPEGGLILTAGIDVQHNRFAVVIRARGKHSNSWLVFHTEIFGNVLNPQDTVWDALESLMFSDFPWLGAPSEKSVRLSISAVSMDSGDGKTADIVYAFINRMVKKGLNIRACKGSSEVSGTKELFTTPADKSQTSTKTNQSLAESMGVTVYTVGTTKGKDTVLRRLAQTGMVDRMYNYKTVVTSYYEQLISNVKRVIGTNRARYVLKSGRADEALDCEVLAEHAARSLYLHIRSEQDFETYRLELLGNAPVIQQKKARVTRGVGAVKINVGNN